MDKEKKKRNNLTPIERFWRNYDYVITQVSPKAQTIEIKKENVSVDKINAFDEYLKANGYRLVAKSIKSKKICITFREDD